MKTKIKSTKVKQVKFVKFLLLIVFLSFTAIANSQTTGYCTVIQQPCNNDGILAVTITSGMTPPLDFYYYDSNGNQFIHSNISILTDTLYLIGTKISYVYATPSLTPWSVYYLESSTGMIAPFTVDPAITTDAICPSLTGTAQITINGGATPASVQWYTTAGWGSGLGTYVGTGNPMTLAPNQYATVIIDGSGCVVTAGIDSTSGVAINNISGINFTISSTVASCTNGTASISGLTGGMLPYTYLWSNGANTTSISGLTQGMYSVTVTDMQGCYNTVSDYVFQSIAIYANPVITMATCLQNDGSIISFGSGGTPPYSYVYSNGMTTQSVTGLSGGASLSVIATDANGCVSNPSYASMGTTTPITVTYSSTNSLCTAPTGSSTLSISGGTAPYTINWNTTPALSGTTITGMPAGSYYFTVTDAVGCVQTGFAVIQPNSVITASDYVSNPICPATTGTVGVNVTGTSPPYTYLWNTGATTSSLTSVPLGNYWCLITDNVGCSLYKYPTLVQASPISLGFSSMQASCLYAADGASLVTPIGGTAPYSYIWSNGQTSATATGLISGHYYAYVTDANGCRDNSTNNHTYVGYNPTNTSCYCTIAGKVYRDANSNCIQDSGEMGIEHIMIHCSGFGYTFTDVNGDYSFAVPTGTYTLSESVQYAYPLAPCQSNSISVSVTASSGCVYNVDFANNVNVIRDINLLRVHYNFAVPGNTFMHGLIVENNGTVNESTVQLGYQTDGQLLFSSTSPVTYTQLSAATEPNWYSVTSGFPSLAPGASTVIYFTDFVPTNIPISTNIFYSDTVSYDAPMSNWLNDFTPWNNIESFQTTVVGSYDPNFKEVSPKGTGVEGFITINDSVLDYVVHFQNTGSYYANKVVVIDTLDADLDWESLHVGFSDHEYKAVLSETGVLTFTFDNIHLDWQSNNELASMGLVSYSIKQKPNLAIGTEITNSAAIYFDYNEPVITNQTVNTIQEPQGILETENQLSITLYPNPTSGDLNIDLSESTDISLINIFDLQGRLVLAEQADRNNRSQKISVANLNNGIYFIELIKTNRQKTTGKFIKN